MRAARLRRTHGAALALALAFGAPAAARAQTPEPSAAWPNHITVEGAGVTVYRRAVASAAGASGGERRKEERSMRKSLFVLAALAAFAGSASAQRPSQAQANAIRQSCRADYQAYCADVPTGGQAALQCLQRNAASLSPSCQQSLAAIGGGGAPPHSAMAAPPMSMREKAAALRQSCAMDYRALCRGVQPGGGRALACLQENSQSLSPRCHDALTAAQAGR